MVIDALDWFIDPGLVSAPAVSMFPVNFDLERARTKSTKAELSGLSTYINSQQHKQCERKVAIGGELR